jgi:small-conductance mechanosensitive channel
MLQFVLYHNTLQSWIYAGVTALVVILAARLLIRLLLRRTGAAAEGARPIWDDLAVSLLERIQPLFLALLGIYIGALSLELPTPAREVVHKAFFLAMLLQIGVLGSHALQAAFGHYRRQALEKNAAAVTTLGSVAFLTRMLLWVFLFLIALDNFGADVTTLIAGLGVGGIAVALAVQNILGDLFASFSIMLDKPFVIGDFIIVGDYLGTIEHIGLKTTRLRSLSGEQLIFSNTDDFEVVYYVNSPDYNLYMDIQQAINLAIFERFAAREITFAYPTQLLYVNREAA